MHGGKTVVRPGEAPDYDEGFLRSLVENAAEGVLALDGDDTVVFANPAIERILGYDPADLVGSPARRLVPARLRAVHEAGLGRHLLAGADRVDRRGVDIRLEHEAGHEVPVSVSPREHEYEGDRLVTAVVREGADRGHRAERLRERTRELEEFADVLAHDLRNPLTVAEGYLDLARERRDDEELRQVEAALERLRQIVDDAQTQARYGRVDGATEVMRFDDVMRAAWDAVPTGEAELVLPERTWRIRADESRLCQLLENLIRNAVEHAGPAPTVRIGVLAAGSGFYVADDGPGLPESVRDRLEGPSGFRPGGAEGYGLQIVGTVSAEHGWEVRATDAVSGGARFEFHGARVFEQ